MTRHVERGVAPQFVQRWSPRAFEPVEIPLVELERIFEAARWAPSAYNSQPWRFLYARRDTPEWSVFLDLLIEFNRAWAQNASALVVVVSARDFTPPGKSEAIQTGSHSFDTGAATACLVLQAHLSDWPAHIITGFDKAKARAALAIPDGFDVEAAIVIGKQGKPESLPPGMRDREAPSDRNPQETWVAKGRFAF
ncbi:MAG: nitroreductase family protein [Zoogloeaceae bacterium]|jgi:nitroreductase|nr:nitroreductase family protein [Zoogloeaceae bacterium]